MNDAPMNDTRMDETRTDDTHVLERIECAGDRPYPPRQSEFTRRFWEGLGQGLFQTTRCTDCGRWSFPPKPFCPHCWSRAVQWATLAPTGVIYSGTTIHAAPQLFRSEAPFQVCIVDLDAGVRLATRLLGGLPTADAIGRRARLIGLKYRDGWLYAARVGPD